MITTNGKDVLTARNIRKSYGSFVANDDVAFELREGEVLGIIGPNGAGKSTLLDIVSGHLIPDRGHTTLFGRNITNAAPDNIALRGMFRTFQRPRFVGELTPLDNLKMAPMVQQGEAWLYSLFPHRWRTQEEEIGVHCRRMIQELDLGKVADQQVRDLSFGQIKLLNFGMALVSGARVIALDEPVAGMSPQMRQAVAGFIRGNDSGHSFLIIEHDMDFLRSVAHRVLLMAEGKAILSGSPEEVLNHPKALDAFLGRK
jgi:branched-chain amino acid transport system ATP-binding protein